MTIPLDCQLVASILHILTTSHTMPFPTRKEIQEATPEQASAMIHEHVFGNTKAGARWKDREGRLTKAPAYHNSEVAMVDLLDRFRLVMGKARPADPHYNPAKEWFCGRLGEFFIIAATPGGATCKATLIAQLGQPKDDEAGDEEEEGA